MPSTSLSKFETKMLVEVDHLIQSHTKLNHTGYGRRGLGHITRSAVLMLCASWELYIEELVVESVKIIKDRITLPKYLPKSVQKELSNLVKNAKHELKPLELAGDGWESLYLNHANNLVGMLNTPKSAQINVLYKKLIGVPDISEKWTLGEQFINDFVSARGDIAHRGRDSTYVKIRKLINYRIQIIQTIIETDNYLADYICEIAGGNSPWRRRRQ